MRYKINEIFTNASLLVARGQRVGFGPPPPPPPGWSSGAHPLAPPPPVPPMATRGDPGIVTIEPGISHSQPNRSKSKASGGNNLFEFLGGKKKASTRKDKVVRDSNDDASFDRQLKSRASSADERRRRLAFLQNDPLNIHQIIMKHLQGSARAPITSVYDLANLITDSCVNLFAQDQAPEEFQFFEFFERSISSVVRCIL